MNKLIGFLAIVLSFYIPAGYAADDWLKDEVLKQLSELRQDNAALHSEVGALKKQVEALAGNKGDGEKKKLADVVGGNATLGKADAKIIVAEFTDYECPFCRKFGTKCFPELRKEYIDTGKVRYVVRDYPLPFHGQARQAAIATRCAGEQKAYWEMKQGLFEHQDRLGKELFAEQAQALKLDGGWFQKCLQEPRIGEAIDRDVAYANSIGVQATPTFLIGRVEGNTVKDIKAVSGAMAFKDFAQQIETMLKR